MNVPDILNRKRSIIWDHVLPIMVCLAYLVIAVREGRNYVVGSYGVSTDFYGGYALDAKYIVNGEFPEGTYNGPGYTAPL